jgi:hypothetical protein
VRAQLGVGDWPFDVIAAMAPGQDPTPFARAGATWALVEIPWERPSIELLERVIRNRPTPVTVRCTRRPQLTAEANPAIRVTAENRWTRKGNREPSRYGAEGQRTGTAAGC